MLFIYIDLSICLGKEHSFKQISVNNLVSFFDILKNSFVCFHYLLKSNVYFPKKGKVYIFHIYAFVFFSFAPVEDGDHTFIFHEDINKEDTFDWLRKLIFEYVVIFIMESSMLLNSLFEIKHEETKCGETHYFS